MGYSSKEVLQLLSLATETPNQAGQGHRNPPNKSP
jgi:hypothetical protein